MPRTLALLLIVLTLVCGGGAQCVPRRGPVAPRLLPEGPALSQIMDVVNANTSRVASYSTNNARVSVAGLPSLPTDIAIERPRRLRLRAGTALTGPEVDLGSNDELFWFWVRRNEPPALFVCRHDRFQQSAAKQVIPIEPEWLIDALGLTQFDPTYHHAGPYPSRDNRLEIHSTLPSGEGNVTKVTVIDAHHGWVLEQHIYNGQGERLASSIASEHTYDPNTQVSLPSKIELQIPRSQMLLKLDVGNVQINTLAGASPELWAKPVYPGYPEIDLSGAGPPVHAAPVDSATGPARAATTIYAPQPQPLPHVIPR